jgi:hypothetical protein
MKELKRLAAIVAAGGTALRAAPALNVIAFLPK